MPRGTSLRSLAVICGAALCGLWHGSASAADKLVVGKAFPTSFGFIPINVGVEAGIMASHGLDVTIIGFEGAPKLQQGITAGDVDVGLGSGTDMAFVMKGAPDKAVAAMAGPPLAYCDLRGRGYRHQHGSGLERPEGRGGVAAILWSFG